MRGIIQTLLTLGLLLSLTGIVNGQQFAPDQQNFGGSNASRPSPDPGIFAPTGGGAQVPDAGSGPSQLVLTFDADLVRMFRLDGELSSAIAADIRNEIGEVIFGFAEPLAASKESNQYESIRPFGIENGALVFEFTENELAAIKTRALRYRFEPQDMGKLETVVIRFRGVNPSQMAQPEWPADPPTRDRLAGNPGNSGIINPPATNPDGLSRSNEFSGLKPLSQTDRSGLAPFPRDLTGNSTNGNLAGRDTLNQPAPLPNRFAARSPQPTSGIDPSQAAEPQMKSWLSEPTNRGLAASQDTTLNQRRQDHLASIQQELTDKDLDLQYRERILAEREKALLAEQEKLSGLPSRTGNFDSNLVGRGADIGPRFANLNPTIPTNVQASDAERRDDTALTELKSTIQTGFNNVSQYMDNLSNRIEAVESQRSLAEGYASQTNPGGIPNRTTRDYSPSMDSFRLGISGADDKSTALNPNMQGPLYFMLLCSLGLNIYLGLVSRNFYVRYNELADELRETFSASISS